MPTIMCESGIKAPRAQWPKQHEIPLFRGRCTLLVPRISDPRYYQWGFQVAFFFVGVASGLFSKSISVLIVVLVVAGLTDLLVTWRITGKLALPQSGFIAANGVALLLESPYLWVYALAAFVAVASKHAFKVGGAHIFNPSSYGILFTLTLFPALAISNGTQWGGFTWFSVFVVLSGLIVNCMARVLTMSMLWIACFLFFAILRSVYLDLPFWATASSATGASFLLFSFFMITDPRTTPTGFGGRLMFCFLVAAIDAAFRMATHPHPHAIFWALVLTSAAYPTLERLAAPWPWREARAPAFQR